MEYKNFFNLKGAKFSDKDGPKITAVIRQWKLVPFEQTPAGCPVPPKGEI
jgi:hypothetical protein